MTAGVAVSRRAAPPPAQAAFDFDAPPAAATPTLADARMLGRAGMLLAESAAGDGFTARAQAFVLGYLAKHGRTAGEVLTDACKLAGIKPRKDDRAFGAVYGGLQRAGDIVKVDTVPRLKGHGTAGGNVWALAGGGST